MTYWCFYTLRYYWCNNRTLRRLSMGKRSQRARMSCHLRMRDGMLCVLCRVLRVELCPGYLVVELCGRTVADYAAYARYAYNLDNRNRVLEFYDHYTSNQEIFPRSLVQKQNYEFISKSI